MNDQERMTDLILTEKKMSTNYNLFASECVNTRLRDSFLGMLTSGHNTQTTLFGAAKSRGWYQTTPAPAAQIQSAYQKFSAMC